MLQYFQRQGNQAPTLTLLDLDLNQTDLSEMQKQSSKIKHNQRKNGDEKIEFTSKLKETESLNTDELYHSLPGLNTYSKPSSHATKQFIQQMDPRKPGSRMILLLLYCFILVVNIYSLAVRQHSE